MVRDAGSPTRIRDRIATARSNKERAVIRAAEVALALTDVAAGTRITRGQRTYEFQRPPEPINDPQARVIGIDLLVKVYAGGRELIVDNHRRFVNPPCSVPDDGVFVQRPDPFDLAKMIDVQAFREDPREAILSCLEDVIRDVPNAAGWGKNATTTTYWASTADGYIQSGGDPYYPTYAAASGAAGNNLVVTTNVGTYGLVMGQDNTYGCYNSFISFDTSDIAGGTVSAAALYIWGDAYSSTPTVQARTYNWGASVTTADWKGSTAFNALTLLASYATTGGWNGGYNLFTESGTNLRTAVNVSGVTYMCLSTSEFAANSTPGADQKVYGSGADYAANTRDPKLTVTHAAAGVGALPLQLLRYQRQARRVQRRFLA